VREGKSLIARILILGLLGVLLGTIPQAAAGRARRKRKGEVPPEVLGIERKLEELAAQGSTGLSRAFRLYCTVENSRRFEEAERYRLHRSLLEAIRKHSGSGTVGVLKRTLRSSSKMFFPARVVAMKALLERKLPLERSERVKLLKELARSKDLQTFIWAVRLLGKARWSEAVEALVELLGEFQGSSGKNFVRRSIVGTELYRVLGNLVRPGAAAGEVKAAWEKLGRKVPAKPDYSPGLSGSGRTVSFFGDVISPLSVFAIDHSTSMLQKVRLSVSGHGTVTGKKKGGERGNREQKVLIVKRELIRMIRSLTEDYRFNILCYNAKVYPWRALRLHAANSSNKASAEKFVKEFEVNRGTNIYQAMKTAFMIRGVETIYLLSDGSPSVGGRQPEIERLVRVKNYLRAVRVVTYGFTPEGRGAFDEAFMKRLASENWGWYRRLNK